jgi:hypothetical protein
MARLISENRYQELLAAEVLMSRRTHDQTQPDVNIPLRCAITADGTLVIRIGIETLKFAAERCPELYDVDKHQGSLGPYIRVTNRKGFAHDVVREIAREDESGNSAMSLLIDEAIMAAIESGSEHVAEIAAE